MSARKNGLGKIIRWRRKWGGRWPDFAKRKAAERRGKSAPAEQGEGKPCPECKGTGFVDAGFTIDYGQGPEGADKPCPKCGAGVGQ